MDLIERGPRAVDYDEAARVARGRRVAAEVDRVRALARTHTDDEEWGQVLALLDRLGLALGRDLGPGSPPR